MRAIGGLVGQVTLNDIRRHTDPNHKGAALAFGEGRVKEALQIYDAQGEAVVQHSTNEQAMDAMVDAWFWMRNHEPKASQLLMAYRRVEVRTLNERSASAYTPKAPSAPKCSCKPSVVCESLPSATGSTF